MCWNHCRIQYRRNKDNVICNRKSLWCQRGIIRSDIVQCCCVLVPYQSASVTTVSSGPIFFCHCFLLLMNTKTLKILPLGCGRNKFQAQPQLQVTDRRRAGWLRGQRRAEQDGARHLPHHPTALPRPPSTKGSLLQKEKQEGRKGITITNNLGQFSWIQIEKTDIDFFLPLGWVKDGRSEVKIASLFWLIKQTKNSR